MADTKFEFGRVGDDITLIDEVLTPDSSRFWPADRYEPGRSQDSFDKQYVRDYLEELDWDKTPPAPALPEAGGPGHRPPLRRGFGPAGRPRAPAPLHPGDLAMIPIRRALVSVYDKTGLDELGAALAAAGVEVVSTGGTAARLRESGVRVTEVSEVTGFPECLDGRVKTLHPKIHAGILADRSNPEHREQIARLEVEPIDLVVVNLYPFEAAAEKEGIGRAELIEQIDIGGPTLLRATAKNCDSAIAVCDPADYGEVIAALSGGGRPPALPAPGRQGVQRTAAYDAAIAARLADQLAAEGPGAADTALPRCPWAWCRRPGFATARTPTRRGRSTVPPAGRRPAWPGCASTRGRS